MADGLSKNICNMIECREFEHPLFRSFGLGGSVDGAPFTRGALQVAVSRWFPGTSVKRMAVEKASGDGSFAYSIEVEVEGSNG